MNGAVESLAAVLFEGAIDQLKNGNLKVQEHKWFPEWGTVITTTVYNCRTCQYITMTNALFFDPNQVSTHAGRAGRCEILVPKHLAGKSLTSEPYAKIKRNRLLESLEHGILRMSSSSPSSVLHERRFMFVAGFAGIRTGKSEFLRIQQLHTQM